MTIEPHGSLPIARLLVFGNAALGAEIGRTMAKLSPRPGDIVVLRLPPGPLTPFDDPTAEARRREFLLGQVSGALERVGATRTVLFALPEGYDLSILDPETMRRFGWVRIGSEDAIGLPEHLKGWTPEPKLDEAEARRHVDAVLPSLATPSTDDPDGDQRFLREYAERDARIHQGLCPNHPDAPVKLARALDGTGDLVCDRCEFRYGRSTILVS